MTSKPRETAADDRAATEKPAELHHTTAEPEKVATRRTAEGECVVDDGTAHMGRAVNGKVCSAHAMHYRSDGTPRAEYAKAATP